LPPVSFAKGFSIEALPETERLNSTLFTETILLDLVQFTSLLRPATQIQAYWLHIENTKPQNSALFLHKTEEL
jgi:hypothetical protein